MFGWLKRKTPRKLIPEALWVVELTGDEVRVVDEAGEVKIVGKGDLSGVIIETNDSGPWGADFWWLLFGADDHVACAIPQGATGEDALINYLLGLPGFDHEQ